NRKVGGMLVENSKDPEKFRTEKWDGLVEAIKEIAPTTIEGVNRNITDLSTTFDQETTIMHGLMEDTRDDRSELRGRVNLLYRDRPNPCRLRSYSF
ncbi:hypothetical protein Tco_0262793, partial [Tanacetum coccineum]